MAEPHVSYFVLFCFWKQSPYVIQVGLELTVVAQAALKLVIFLSQLLKCWDSKHALPRLVFKPHLSHCFCFPHKMQSDLCKAGGDHVLPHWKYKFKLHF